MFAVELWVLTELLGSLEEETVHVEVGWVGCIAGVSCEPEGACAPHGSGGSVR